MSHRISHKVRRVEATNTATRLVAPVAVIRRTPPSPSAVYLTLWQFACERQQIFNRRLIGQAPPWTSDPILLAHRFTNPYRASDRVSQYLIRRVIYNADLPQEPIEVLFRILLFKLFNRIETWETLEQEFGALTWKGFQFDAFADLLSRAQNRGQRLYSAAYIMPSTGTLGESVKHRGHLRLVELMLRDGCHIRLVDALSMKDAFHILLTYPTLGPFLAFQLAIDTNYSQVTNFSEMDFVVAGPGALDGLRKCFSSFGDYCEEEVIRWVTDRQEMDPAKFGFTFPKLFGRSLQLIDVQNLFCEVSKYARVAHPGVQGTNGRSRIKQLYRSGLPAPSLFYPPKWGINERIPESSRAPDATRANRQYNSLFTVL